MRTTIILVLAAIVAASCGTGNRKTNYDKDISILLDRTDTLTVRPSADEFISFLGLDEDIWQAVRVKIGTVTDVDVSQTKTVILPEAYRLLGNAEKRQKEVKRFREQLQKQLEEVSEPAAPLPHSVIYRQVARCLNDLAARQSQLKALFLYSNLQEHSEISFIDDETFSLLETNPKVLQEQLQQSLPLVDLTGITVYCIHRPQSFEANSRFMKYAGLYKDMLSQKNAVLKLQGSSIALQ